MRKFAEKVVELARSIPEGRVSTYGRIARAAGGGGMAAQSITHILDRAERAGARGIPFHRIVYADGRIWVDDAHRAERLRLYKREKIGVDERGRITNFRKVLYEFR